MEDLSSITASEMLARRHIAESEFADLIGQFVFQYSRFVTGLHLCVAWHNEGRDLDNYGTIAEDLGAAELLKKIEKQARAKLGDQSVGFKKYKTWLVRAHRLREVRNTIMHSRWGIEAYGRHAIAIPTPIFVEPAKEIILTSDQLRDTCRSCEELASELYALRKAHRI